MQTIMRSCWRGFALGLVLLSLAKLSPGQTPEPAPKSIHLVGHEETALLLRIQDAIDDWDPRALVNPYLKAIKPAQPGGKTRYAVRRSDLLEFIADADAAVALGKAFFWDIQAGSDFAKDGEKFVGTACASCHYRFGQDARNRHTSRVPFVGWDKYVLHPNHRMPAAGPYDPQQGQFKQLPQDNTAVVTDFKASLENPADKFNHKIRWWHNEVNDPKNLSLIIGSQGVSRRVFKGLTPQGDRWEEISVPAPAGQPNPTPEEWEMFRAGDKNLRQITNRNTPTVINATFSDRLFHDGRAESTFNGFSIFGDRDQREIIYKRTTDLLSPDKKKPILIPVKIALSHAALASQAVGPVVNEVEMSYEQRTFHDLAKKLLDSKILLGQAIHANDSVFAGMNIKDKDKDLKYRELIKRAFRQEWWNDDGVHVDEKNQILGKPEKKVPLELNFQKPDRTDKIGTLMEANFSLYWGLSLMLYQSTLISNNSPFDQMMRGNAEGVWKAWAKHEKRIGDVHLDLSAYTRPIKPGVPKVPKDEIDVDSKIRAKLLEAGQKGQKIDNPKIIATAVFQRGMRAFEKHDCRDCHDGPNLSELFDRTANNRIEEGISKKLSHTLFPNAQGDAAGTVLVQSRKRIVEQIADLIDMKKPELTRVKRLAIGQELFGLLMLLEGDFGPLDSRIGTILDGYEIPKEGLFELIRDRLIQYELTTRNDLGRRPYFRETERIALAELITDPVLIEKMELPYWQLFSRRPMPTGGTPWSPYAFYDAGFYALGVTHARFDRGVGGLNPVEDDDDAAPAAEPALSRSKSIQQSASGASGSAYRLPSNWKGSKASPQKNAVPRNAPDKRDVDTSWSRTELIPELTLDEIDVLKRPHRRSQTSFKSRARQLVVNEEPTGHRKPFLHDNELAFWGAFKTPTLRNVELTAPYMHNGQLLTLEEVIEFYDRGGHIDRSRAFNPDKHPRIRRQSMTTDEKKALLFFLLCLTDDAVRTMSGVFDHPSLRIPNGDQWIEIAERGREPLKPDNPDLEPSLFPSEK